MNGAPAKPISGVDPSSETVQPDGLVYKGHVGRRESRHPIEVGHRADRLLDDRTDARDDVDTDAGGGERDHDVAEEDRGVDAVTADRLEGDLADKIRTAGGLHHRDAGAQRPIFRKRPAGLPHEPDGRMGDRLATTRRDEG